MITQEIIESFFLNMIEDMRKENIPILTNYFQNFKDYPSELEIVEENETEPEMEEEIFEIEL